MPDERPANPLYDRYVSPAMAEIFSDRRRYGAWREIWIALAECEAELGVPIADADLAALRAVKDDADLARVAEIERETRHDVVAHLRHFAEQAGPAGGILHLGATSAFITDNADLILIREALGLVGRRLAGAIAPLAEFARRTREIPTLAYTHLQPAQLTTVGKRACLWIQDLLEDLREVRHRIARLRFRGAKGTTGTQASFLSVFGGDHDKVVELDRRLAERFGFPGSFPVTGQTYPRKQDSQVLAALAGVAESCHKLGTDVRLLQGMGQLTEPFGSSQVGSSAMPYKRNPIRSERMCALARKLLTNALNGPLTASTQWLERSLDDSANRRLVLPESFLLADAILLVAADVARGLTVREGAVAVAVERELPFMATEELLMRGTVGGGDRQALHERIRAYSLEAHAAVERGEPNPLLDRLTADPDFELAPDALAALRDPESFTGRSTRQVEEFLAGEVEPALAEIEAAEPEPLRV